MSSRAAWAAGAIVAVVLAAVGAATMWPTGADDYRDTVREAAQGTLSAVRTVATVAGLASRGRVTDAYVEVVLDNARTAVAASEDDLVTTAVPDGASGLLHDRLAVLLDRAIGLLSDDDRALHSGPALDRLGDDLWTFTEATR